MAKRVLRIEFSSSFHHGSGFGLAGLVDRLVLRDGSGVPYLAGSAIKGRLRWAVLRILTARGQPACRYGPDPPWCEDGNPCPLCLLFGSPRGAGTLRFSDAYPVGDDRPVLHDLAELRTASGLHLDSSVRAATAIDRVRGTAKPNLLFTTETLPASLGFEATIEGDAGAHEALLKEACNLLNTFGADAARGLGRCRFRLGDPS